MPLPILYSLRRCPYCIRARLGLLLAEQPVSLRDVVIKNKPEEMLAISPKGTVPVLQLTDSSVIDESLDIMLWALTQNDPKNILYREQPEAFTEMKILIARSDNDFVSVLEKYKTAARYHHNDDIEYRQQCEVFIAQLEQHLERQAFIMGDTPSLVDYALLPFIRQFSRVDRQWYLSSPYPYLQRWLIAHYQNPIYSKALAYNSE
ncbi:glutathione S-transferase [Photobacterium nomapromontoriensis]|uniref:glutathione S-transferase n=1 Tax=Photobacterium nomapromontoriensis TaxID=2910237 RepID=UPI003D0BDB62